MDAMVVPRTPIIPLVSQDFTSLRTRFTAACFQGPGNEWSLGPLQESGDADKHPVLKERLRNAMRFLGAERVYAPSPVKFNGRIIRPFELTTMLRLDGGVLMFRNGALPADGTFLRYPGDAGIFSARGCGVTVAALYENLIFAHTGRDCVIDKQRVLTGEPSRSKESVVDYIVAAFLELGYGKEDLRNLHAWPLYSVRPENFVHRYDNVEHREFNGKVRPDMLKNGLGPAARAQDEGVEIDVSEIARLQFMQHSVPEANIHMDCRYLPEGLPTTGTDRYLVAIVRH